MSIGTEIPFSEGGNTLPINIQRLVKAIRTDLDCFSDREIVFLVQHGYSVARHHIEALSEECRPYSEASSPPPIARLMLGVKKVPQGRWLPPRTEPGWRRDEDALIWDNDPDDVKLTQCVASLRFSGEMRLHLVSLRDRVSLMTVVCLLALLGGIGYAGWRVMTREPPPSIPSIVYSSLGGELDKALFPVDPSMPGITITERALDIDLRNEVPVRPADRDSLRIAPSVHTYTIKGVRTSTARFLVYQFTSQRKLMDAVCITSHPYQVRYRQVPGGDGLDNVYTIIIDVSQHLPGIPFNVEFRVTRWNAYQAANQNFVAALVSGEEHQVTLRVLLPIGKVYKSTTVQARRQGAAQWSAEPEDSRQPVPDRDRTWFTWTLKEPRQGWAYRATIEWE
jgi:hypothetical protein